MINTKKFQTKAEYDAYMKSLKRVLPNVTFIAGTRKVKYKKAIKPKNCIAMTAFGAQTVTKPEGSNMEYSYNGKDWSAMTTAVEFGTTNETVYIRGKENWWFDNKPFVFGNSAAKVELSGNAMALIDWENISDIAPDEGFSNLFSGATALYSVSKNFLPAKYANESCYMYMFKGCTSLVSAPNLPAIETMVYSYESMFEGCTSLTSAPVISAENMAKRCCQFMFSGCTSLKTAPSLPSTNLSEDCYNGMFNSCKSLVNAPSLPATELPKSCYCGMFEGCTSLVNAPSLPSTALNEYCYCRMFEGCTSLKKTPELPATTLFEGCYSSMFSHCESLINAPALPATTLKRSCYYSLFSRCISLETAPKLPAETLAPSCYQWMFSNCIKINEIYCSATSISASNCTREWLEGVASAGTFYSKPSTPWTIDSPNGIPVGWTRIINKRSINMTASAAQTVTPPAGTFEYSFDKTNWSSMTTAVEFGTSGKETIYIAGKNISGITGHFSFGNTTSLVSLGGNCMALLDWENVPTAVPASGFTELFAFASAIQSVTEDFLPATELNAYCYSAMFVGCMKLSNTPKLPATTMKKGCYSEMFGGTSITTAPELPATTLVDRCYEYMLNTCPYLATAPNLPAKTLVSNCYLGMFHGDRLITEIHCDATDISADGCTNEWLSGVASTGNFYGKAAANWSDGESGIPNGWTKHLS